MYEFVLRFDKSVRCGRVCVGVNLHTLVVSVAEG